MAGHLRAIGIASALLVTGAATGALAQNNVGDVAREVSGQFTDIVTLVGSIAMTVGVILFVIGILKARAMSQNPQDPSNRVSTVVITLVVAAALLVLPEVFDVGITSLFGAGQTGAERVEGSDLLN